MKRIVFLGSSVTYGEASGGVSFADMLCEKYGYEMVKEAVSGTTLVDEGADSYVSRLKNITVNDADLFICQLSTNDATGRKPLGEIADSRDMNFFDTKMTGSGLTLVSKLLFCSPNDFPKDLKKPINKIKPNWEEKELNFYLLSHDIHNPMIINYIEHNITKI